MGPHSFLANKLKDQSVPLVSIRIAIKDLVWQIAVTAFSVLGLDLSACYINRKMATLA